MIGRKNSFEAMNDEIENTVSAITQTEIQKISMQLKISLYLICYKLSIPFSILVPMGPILFSR